MPTHSESAWFRLAARWRSLPAAALLLLPLLAPRAPAQGSEPADPYLWLEDVTGKKALRWVEDRNRESARALTRSREFEALEARLLAVLDSDAKIPYARKIGDLYYNFWKDKTHERGLWRRTTLEEYRKERPAWETVLDLDSLSRLEDENWVWHDAQPLPPEETRCLVSLSRGGADADVIREFDLVSKSFVKDGFTLPEAKQSAGWKHRDTLYVQTDFGPGSMTTSGYPRIAKEWARGTPLSEARLVFEGQPGDVAAGAYRDHTPAYARDFVYRAVTFYTNEMYLRRGGALVKIDKPDDADADVFREWLLLKLRSDWKAGSRTWPAGALLAIRVEDFLAGKRDFDLLFEPGDRKSLDSYAVTRSAIVVNELDNVRNRLYRLEHRDDRWNRAPLAGLPDFGAIEVSAVDSHDSDDYWLTIKDFLTPTTFHLGKPGAAPERLKQMPAYFDAGPLAVTQHEAVSKDGTRIPYFQVARKDLALDGTTPTLLYGYGGFELSELPVYSGLRGGGWLEKGGVLVVANIRGGGEFGPRWHQAALKAHRHRAYEDFIAVAEDLIRRKVTTPKRLGCMGGSNGGLLVGNMLTMRPDLFGAVVCQVPLLDMRRYSKLLAGASWMGEYGDPDDPKEWAFLRDYSPYHNVRKGAKYPPVLFTTSTRDDRVHPGHARKMVAKMLAQGHDVLYYENVEGGHGGAATNRQSAHMWALAYAFLWKELGATGPRRAWSP